MATHKAMPDRFEDTVFLYSLFKPKWGLQTAVANIFGCYAQDIQAQIDINNSERHCWFAQFKRFQWSVDSADADVGDAIFTNLCESRRRWRNGPSNTAPLPIHEHVGRNGAEFVDIATRVAAGDTDEAIIKEIDENIASLQRMRDDIQTKIERKRVDEVCERRLGMHARVAR